MSRSQRSHNACATNLRTKVGWHRRRSQAKSRLALPNLATMRDSTTAIDDHNALGCVRVCHVSVGPSDLSAGPVGPRAKTKHSAAASR